MGKLTRCISKDGTVTVMAMDATDIVVQAQCIHKTSKVTSAALGRALTAVSMMGTVLKGRDDSVTLKINGGGPAGSIIGVSDSSGNVRGYIGDSTVELPLNSKGKLDVAGAVGTDGYVTVIKDLGLKEPYIGQVPVISGEIAEDITSYYAVSEQIPTVCGLGVLVSPEDKQVIAAGGFLIQLLPAATEETIQKIEACVQDIPPVSAMLKKEMTPGEICRKILPDFELDVLDESRPVYKCNCSAEKVSRALLSTGVKELEDMAKDKVTEVKCNFCDRVYRFSPSDIRSLIRQAAK